MDAGVNVLLVSTYELGHQPLGLAAPAAVLRARGHEVRCLDLAVEAADPALFAQAGLVAVSVPMHTAARLGIALARRVREWTPDAHICFYGLYASTLHDLLLNDATGGAIADSVAGGEYESALCAIADALAEGRFDGARPPAGTGAEPLFARQRLPAPDRDGLPPLERYAQVETAGGTRLAGYVEATRGCAHRCRHCPITPVYEGRLRLVQRESVLADIDRLAAMGAEHITFGDPDFLNAVPHSLAIVDELHRRHPRMTFDATVKVEHLLEHAEALPRLRDAGCLFITSAFESCDDEVLRALEKGHTRADMERALALAARERLTVRPTWVAFTPWGTAEHFLEMLRFVEDHGLVRNVPPVQYALRLLLPPDSTLLPLLREQGRLGPFDAERLTFEWTNPDPRIEPLRAEVAAIAEQAATACTHDRPDDALETFARVKRAALAAIGDRASAVSVAPQPRGVVPGLTEAWFC